MFQEISIQAATVPKQGCTVFYPPVDTNGHFTKVQSGLRYTTKVSISTLPYLILLNHEF